VDEFERWWWLKACGLPVTVAIDIGTVPVTVPVGIVLLIIVLNTLPRC
jgi:hypothetical protein